MEITKEQKKQIQKVGKKHGLDFIVLHGSQVTGKKGPEADVDIAIYRSGGIDFEEQMKIFPENLTQKRPTFSLLCYPR